MSEHLVKLIENVGHPRILVVGDLILDRYVWGQASRISAEGPIPILEVASEEERPGGAGNVVSSLSHLEARVSLCSVVGRDAEGEAVRQLLRKQSVNVEGLLSVGDRPTTVKTRYIGYVQSANRGIQQMLRVDRESRNPVQADVEKQLLAHIDKTLPDQQAVVLSDYDKELLTEKILSHTIALARKHGIPVVTDPKIGRPYSVYKGSTVLKPNRYETKVATGILPGDEDTLRAAAAILLKTAELKYVIISLDRDGIYLAGEGEAGIRIAARPKAVVDITGAGDMVVSVLALMLACGADIRDAAVLANAAAEIEVSKIGCAPVSRDEILNNVISGSNLKLRTIESAAEIARECRRTNRKVVWTNGCFDIFHIGHYEYLKYARQQGDFLIVGLNSDASVRRLKGPNRPITNEEERARLLAAVDVVDGIVIYDEDTPCDCIRLLRPDVLVKGGDYKREEDVVGWDIVKSYGGKVALAPYVNGVSTTDIVQKILQRYGEQQKPGDGKTT